MDLTNLLTEESCIIHQIKENLFVFLFLKLVFPISIYRKIYIRNSKCWLKNRYGARSLRYNWRGIEALIIINDILRKSKSMESFSFIQGFVLCTCFSLFFVQVSYRDYISDLFGKKRIFFIYLSKEKSPVKTILRLTEALPINQIIYSF